MGRYITSTGTAGSVIRNVNSSTLTTYTALVNDRILANTNTAAITITLPASGMLDGDTIQIIDAGGYSSTNNITVLRNGQNIQGSANDLTIDLNNSTTTLLYTASYGWLVSSV